MRLSRDVGGECRIGEGGGGDDVRAGFFDLRARRGQGRVARERLVDRLLAREPQRLEGLRRCSDGKREQRSAQNAGQIQKWGSTTMW